MYIDSHAHLFDKDLQPDLEDVLRRAQDAGISAIVVPGTTAETSELALDLSDRFDFVYACVGVHPHEALNAGEESFRRIDQMAKHSKAVAIGEIGLDYYYDFAPQDLQKEVLARQIGIAASHDLPVVVHTRDSVGDALATIRTAVCAHPEWLNGGGSEEKKAGGRGVFHCFTGTAEEARELFSLGLTVSYPGIVTFKNSPVLRTLREIGFGKILLETDSPYLTPVPYRGKRNEPSYLPLIANKIAELFNESPSVIGQQTSENARALFSLPG